ncbi:GntR family transcriptional regulator [Plantactinospora sp. S1510]|uniref:GntR family transcriptional regulator n=1 Tax=Plantactinospora alkalitolerans TaxID=2789879 RepID=A0ABS0H6A9_9ACTN|nr:GntR family transcriptional regulator [Plantactinospora alkalitolerans]MBF9133999.1 GntR family transcriptional regulator [Plantactinospora alkalitolerans]
MPRGLFADDALPLYERTAAQLIDDLRATGARAGDRLPSERALATRYAVSRVTLRAALAELESRGIVRPSSSRGWFVASLDQLPDPSTASTAAAPQVQGLADFARVNGLTPSTRVLSAAVRPATVSEAEALRIAPGADLFELHRLRFLDDLLVVLEHNRLPLAACPALAETDFNTASLYATLRAANPPQLLRVADYSCEARHPTPREIELFQISDTMPMLVATQLTFNQADRPIELTIQVYRGDRYRFRASITNRP